MSRFYESIKLSLEQAIEANEIMTDEMLADLKASQSEPITKEEIQALWESTKRDK